ncbi:MAG: class I SAM-dependent methyltransferase [Alphaproteobacteria bacterium]|nr:class I SAM-dependent methyltransferase [Alphaproteobacteria bacterium]
MAEDDEAPSGIDRTAVARAPLVRLPALRLLVAAIAGAAVGYFLLTRGALDALPVPPGWPAAAIAALAAGAIGFLLGQRGVWPLLSGVLVLSAVAILALAPPLWFYPLAIMLLAGLFWNVRSDRVPLYLTNSATTRALAALAESLPDGARMIDLGSGLGGVVRGLARARPDLKVAGVETAPLPFAASRLLLSLFGPSNADIRYQDIWSVDLGAYDIVYCFLSSEPMPRLVAKARAEMKPGAVLVSNSFTPVGAELDGAGAMAAAASEALRPDRRVRVDDRRETTLYIWNL